VAIQPARKARPVEGGRRAAARVAALGQDRVDRHGRAADLRLPPGDAPLVAAKRLHFEEPGLERVGTGALGYQGRQQDDKQEEAQDHGVSICAGSGRTTS
jgi:hypothetical protein